MMDWTDRHCRVFHRLLSDGREIASLYRIGETARARGMRPHWTSYIHVPSVDAAAARAELAGGTVLVRPFDIGAPGVRRITRIALIADPDGAVFGLWDTPPPAA